jgi:hypothetical protein
MGIIDDIFTLRRQNDFRSDGVWPTTVTAPAATAPTAGWYATGINFSPLTLFSTIDRIIFATDTTALTTRGATLQARFGLSGGATDSTNGWFGGGYVLTPAAASSRVDRVTFATDTANPSVRGSLTAARYDVCAMGDYSTNGYWLGGSYPIISRVDRVTFATDTATASTKASLFRNTRGGTSTGTSVYGWYMMGDSDVAPTRVSDIYRITYATDTAASTLRGYMSFTGSRTCGSISDTTTYAWTAGATGDAGSRVQRITFATDTATASVRGPLSANGYRGAVTGNLTDGWFAHGTNSIQVVTISRINFATDTATTVEKASLTVARCGEGSFSGTI